MLSGIQILGHELFGRLFPEEERPAAGDWRSRVLTRVSRSSSRAVRVEERCKTSASSALRSSSRVRTCCSRARSAAASASRFALIAVGEPLKAVGLVGKHAKKIRRTAHAGSKKGGYGYLGVSLYISRTLG